MRVLYLTRGYTAHDHRFLVKLAQTGNEIGYARLVPAGESDDPHPVPDGVQRMDLAPTGRRPGWADLPRLRRRLTEVIREFSPDVVHAGPVQQGGLLAAWANARPLVTMSWGSDILLEARGGPGRLAARFALARTSVFVCDCRAVSDAAIALGAPAGRVVIFPWGADLDRFSPGDGSALRRRLGWEGSFVLLSTRAWEPLYGLDTLVDGFIRAARSEPGLRLLLLGQGSLEPWIRARVVEAGLSDRVHFAARVALEDLPAYYRAADLYVSASRSDGSSVSLLEAMACGLPALVSNIAGNREWVSPEDNGWWFPVGKGGELADAIRTALKSRDRLRGMGGRGRAIAEARADWDRNFPRLLDAYRLAIAQERAR